MDRVSFVGNADVDAIDELYKRYKENPENVDKGWAKFFEGFDFAQTNYAEDGEIPENLQKEFKVISLIDDCRRRGHLFTKTNPVRERRQYSPTLDLENYGLSDADLETVFQSGETIGIGASKLKDIVAHLKKVYCESIGSQYMHIRDDERRNWIMNQLENDKLPKLSTEDKKRIFKKLSEANLFEEFLQKKYVGQKRFSVEGSEAMISGLHEMIRKGAHESVEEFIVGMAHRGRLNVLVNILGKDLKELFGEFEGKEFDDLESFDGDVKYHLGLTNNQEYDGKTVQLTLAPNPSHLEAVGAVVEGITRAKIDNYVHSTDKIIPIIIHGDAAIAGQGVVYEVIQMAGLKAYDTGGTVHIIANNQVGFTTNYLDGRTSTYCTDLAKVTEAPSFHINGDDVEAVVKVFLMALDYRQKFHKDIFIDILSYRKYGHNEGDEPKFTQPNLYDKIKKHPNPREIYKAKLIKENLIDKTFDQSLIKDIYNHLDTEYEASKSEDKVIVTNFLSELWKQMEVATAKDFDKDINTTFDKKKLIALGEKLATLPENKKIFRKIAKLFNDRIKMIKKDQLDWGIAEMMAYATLLVEGHSIRFAGQDSERGTFSHRHAVVKTEDTEERIITLNTLEKEQKTKFEIYNSLLSEYAALGFEYGYSLATPDGLTIWEAQFGDFANGGQIIFDQFISAAEDKWNVHSGLVMLLPHGYEGQGSEHSSARLERYLQSCADLNIQVINPTTPANNFHALRRQMHRKFRKPLIVMSPKVLLRHPKATSTIDELAKGTFQEVFDDPRNLHKTANTIVLCSGKVYYDFLEAANERNVEDMAFVRVEQLYPLPRKKIDEVLAKYKNAERIIWGQEEPENMGAWTYIAMQMRDIHLICVARPAAAAPAEGSKMTHLKRLKELHENLFRYAAETAK